MTDYLTPLNEEQRQAVEALDGPLLVLAGAGTGKTRVLTTRFAHILLSKKAFPNQVLAVTFTNKAAREMRERVAAILGQPAEGLWLGTFHALCARMLRRHAEHAGLSANFTILDADDQLRLLKQVMDAGRIDTKRWTPGSVMALIQRWKDRGLTPARAGVEAADDADVAGARGLRRLSGAAAGAECRRFRRSDPARDGDSADPAGYPGAVPPQFPLHPGGRIPGHQPRAVSLAAAAGPGTPEHLLRGGRRSVDLFLARRRGGKYPALRKGFRRRENRPARVELSLDRADSRRRVHPDRPQHRPIGQDPARGPEGRRRAARKSRSSGCGIPTKRPAWSASVSNGFAATAIRSAKSPCWCAPASRPARSRNG